MQSTDRPVPTEDEALRAIGDILDANRTMAISTLREDGWPQTTMVSYLRDGLTLYFLVARDSQKLSNIQHDPRVSIALGRFEGTGVARGISMSARVSEVTDAHRIEALNRLMWSQPKDKPFEPRPATAATALLQASPEYISLIDHASSPGQTRLYLAHPAWRLELATERSDAGWSAQARPSCASPDRASHEDDDDDCYRGDE